MTQDYSAALSDHIAVMRQAARTSTTAPERDAVYLTGSYAQGTAVLEEADGGWQARSDADILVLTQGPFDGEGLCQQMLRAGMHPSVHVTSPAAFAAWQPTQFTWELAHTAVDLLEFEREAAPATVRTALSAFAAQRPRHADAARLVVNRFAEHVLDGRSGPSLRKLARAVVDAHLIDVGELPAGVRNRPGAAIALLPSAFDPMTAAYGEYVQAPWLEARRADDHRLASTVRRVVAEMDLDLGARHAPRSLRTEAQRQLRSVLHDCWTPTRNIDRWTHNTIAADLRSWAEPRDSTLRRWSMVHGH